MKLEKDEDIGVIRVHLAHPGSILLTTTLLFTLLSIYIFSDFTTHILFHIILYISSCQLSHKGMDSLRLLVDARSLRPVTHLRFQASSDQAQKPGFSEPPLGIPVRPKPSIKNSIPVILSGVNEKFKNWRKLMGELRQFHSSLKISQIKELPKG